MGGVRYGCFLPMMPKKTNSLKNQQLLRFHYMLKSIDSRDSCF